MREKHKAETGGGGSSAVGARRRGNSSAFGTTAVALQCLSLVLLGLFSGYGDAATPRASPSSNPPDSAAQTAATATATSLLGVHALVFVGVSLWAGGWLRRFALSSVAFALFSGATALQWSLLFDGLWRAVLLRAFAPLRLDALSVLRADHGALCAFVALAASLGTLSASQTLVSALLCTAAHALLRAVLEAALLAPDPAGSLAVFAFGSAFGLALSRVAAPANRATAAASSGGDVLGMAGAAVVWVCFLALNTAFVAPGPPLERALLHTALALAGSCTAAFAFSAWARPGHRMHVGDVLAASVAGGVAVGSAAPLVLWPAGALTVGVCGGVVSLASELGLRQLLRRKLGINDTAGVLSAFLLPGVVGGAAVAVASVFATTSTYGSELLLLFPAMRQGHTASSQALLELAAIGASVGFGLLSGLLTGALVSAPLFRRGTFALFDDKQHWHTAALKRVASTSFNEAGAAGVPQQKPIAEPASAPVATSPQQKQRIGHIQSSPVPRLDISGMHQRPSPQSPRTPSPVAQPLSQPQQSQPVAAAAAAAAVFGASPAAPVTPAAPASHHGPPAYTPTAAPLIRKPPSVDIHGGESDSGSSSGIQRTFSASSEEEESGQFLSVTLNAVSPSNSEDDEESGRGSGIATGSRTPTLEHTLSSASDDDGSAAAPRM